MAATANRTASTWTPQLIGALEKFVNDGNVEDLLIRKYLYYAMLKANGRVKTGTWGHTQAVAVNQTSTGGVTWFNGMDTIAAPIPDGPQAGQAYRAQCAKGLSVTATEEADNPAGGAVDLIEHRYTMEFLDFLQDWNSVLITGNVADAKRPDGLEQAVAPYDNITVEPSTASVNQLRQAANSYLGIQRVASAGTGWENVSANFDQSEADALTGGTWDSSTGIFALGTNSQPTIALRALQHVNAACSDGNWTPDLFMSTRKPFEDYATVYPQTLRYMVSGTMENEQTFDIKVDNIKYGRAIWGYSDEFAASGAVGNADAGADMLYLLNTDQIELLVEDGWNFGWRPFVDAINQMAKTGYIVWRGFHIFRNPRTCGVIFNYGQA